MSLIKSISGIRGTIGGPAGDGLSPLDIVKFTAAYATFIRKSTTKSSNTIVVGRDARLSGEMVKDIVVGTLNGMGFDVVNIGLATTPTTELAVVWEKACGGIILTASHNPKQWNALKLLNEKGEFLNDAEGKEVLAIAEAESFTFAEVDKLGHEFINDTYTRKHIDSVLDLTIITASAPAISNGKEVSLEYAIANTDRAVGAMLSGLIANKFGNEGLPDESISVRFKGSAGQSFGAFLAHGISFKLEGEANDYLGKGLSGGRIAVAPPVRSHFAAEKNTIAGNTLLYGATSGEVYINGRVGERFAVRNSGAIAVVEGVGDHCCEYMTGGRVVVLGATGRNFAAGMSGGVAYVWDPDRKFDYFCNMEMVELSLIEDSTARKELHELIRQHYRYTGSALARQMLDEWNRYVDDFIQVTPIEYKRVLAEEQMLKLQQKIAEVQRDY